MGNLKVMVGVSTAQNISNFIPAIQKQVEKVVLLETTTAQKEQWSNGIQNVLDSKNYFDVGRQNL